MFYHFFHMRKMEGYIVQIFHFGIFCMCKNSRSTSCRMVILAYCPSLVNSFIEWEHNRIIGTELSIRWSKKYAPVSFIIQLIYHVIEVLLVKSSSLINGFHTAKRNKEIWIFCESILHRNFSKFGIPYFMHVLSHAYAVFDSSRLHPFYQLINIRIFWN